MDDEAFTISRVDGTQVGLLQAPNPSAITVIVLGIAVMILQIYLLFSCIPNKAAHSLRIKRSIPSIVSLFGILFLGIRSFTGDLDHPFTR